MKRPHYYYNMSPKERPHASSGARRAGEPTSLEQSSVLKEDAATPS